MKTALQLIFLMMVCGFSSNAQTNNNRIEAKQTNNSEWAGLMSLYPSPAKTYVNLNVEWPSPQTFKVAIYDTGSVLLKEWDATRKVYQHTIDVTQLPVGTYTVVITSTNGGKLKGDFMVIR